MTPVEKYVIEEQYNKETDLLTDQEYAKVGKYIVTTALTMYILKFEDANKKVAGVDQVLTVVNNLINKR